MFDHDAFEERPSLSHFFRAFALGAVATGFRRSWPKDQPVKRAETKIGDSRLALISRAKVLRLDLDVSLGVVREPINSDYRS